jgi:catechol 2,3-dioxygenase-like lactoylglutathione lyase family enzyme
MRDSSLTGRTGFKEADVASNVNAIGELRFNHLGVVVTDLARAEEFYVGVLGLARHAQVDSWFWLTDTTTIHLIEIPEAQQEVQLFKEVNHVAFEVSDLQKPHHLLLNGGLKPFQMDFEGNTKDVTALNDGLEFGIGTVFTTDPSGNLIEFLQPGKGMFTTEKLQIHAAAAATLESRATGRGLNITGVNHACLVTKETEPTTHGFWVQRLGLSADSRDQDGDWFTSGSATFIHTAPTTPKLSDDPAYAHSVNHLALEVPSVADALDYMIKKKQTVLKVATDETVAIGAECIFAKIDRLSDILDSPTRPSFFVRDPDGNMFEFGERGRGEY